MGEAVVLAAVVLAAVVLAAVVLADVLAVEPTVLNGMPFLMNFPNIFGKM